MPDPCDFCEHLKTVYDCVCGRTDPHETSRPDNTLLGSGWRLMEVQDRFGTTTYTAVDHDQ